MSYQNVDDNGNATNTVKFVLTDPEGIPLKCDNNKAHFDGLVYEIAQCIARTGKFKSLVEQGIVFKGKTTIVDSAAAVPFVLGGVTWAVCKLL